MTRRLDIRTILKDPKLRRELLVDSIVALQNREGIPTTRQQAEAAYDAVASTKSAHLSADGGRGSLREKK